MDVMKQIRLGFRRGWSESRLPLPLIVAAGWVGAYAAVSALAN